MSPAESVEWSAALIAAMPDPNACAASAPSSSAMTRFSSSTVGLRRRAYVKPYSSSAMTAPELGDAVEGEGRRGDDRADDRLAGSLRERRRVDRTCGEAQPALAHGHRPSPSRSGSVADRGRLEGDAGCGRAVPVGLAVADVQRPRGLDAEPLEGDPEDLGVGFRRSGLRRADDRREGAREPGLFEVAAQRDVPVGDAGEREAGAGGAVRAPRPPPASGRKTMLARNAGVNSPGSRSAPCVLEEDGGAPAPEVGEARLVAAFERAREVVGNLGAECGCDLLEARARRRGRRAPAAAWARGRRGRRSSPSRRR